MHSVVARATTKLVDDRASRGAARVHVDDVWVCFSAPRSSRTRSRTTWAVKTKWRTKSPCTRCGQMAQPEVKLANRLSLLTSPDHSVIVRYKAAGKSCFSWNLLPMESGRCTNSCQPNVSTKVASDSGTLHTSISAPFTLEFISTFQLETFKHTYSLSFPPSFTRSSTGACVNVSVVRIVHKSLHPFQPHYVLHFGE